jgi:hypothetical protein
MAALNSLALSWPSLLASKLLNAASMALAVPVPGALETVAWLRAGGNPAVVRAQHHRHFFRNVVCGQLRSALEEAHKEAAAGGAAALSGFAATVVAAWRDLVEFIYKPPADAVGWKPGERSLAVRLELQPQDATLTEEGIQAVVDAALSRAHSAFGARLRT